MIRRDRYEFKERAREAERPSPHPPGRIPLLETWVKRGDGESV
jgi:hypothetical protein